MCWAPMEGGARVHSDGFSLEHYAERLGRALRMGRQRESKLPLSNVARC